jgi:hypothetical protein
MPAGDSAAVLILDLFEAFCSHPDIDAPPQDLFANEPCDTPVPLAMLVESPRQEERVPATALDADDRWKPHPFPHNSNILANTSGRPDGPPPTRESLRDTRCR